MELQGMEFIAKYGYRFKCEGCRQIMEGLTPLHEREVMRVLRQWRHQHSKHHIVMEIWVVENILKKVEESS